MIVSIKVNIGSDQGVVIKDILEEYNLLSAKYVYGALKN